MVLRLSEKTHNAIVERLTSSFRTITIVVGPTGCGKSTLVPIAVQTALGRDGAVILCTQPRRLAVVAVATRVAQMKQCRLGELVGYHVGQSNVTNRKETKIIFATAGILLEEILANGIKALERYECLLIDECHERSAESDLCLALLRMLLRSHPQAPIRVILMSATFDHQRYRSYFESVPGVDFVDVITLETAESFSSFYDRVQTLYLDDFIKQLPDKDAHKEFMATMKRDPNIDLTVTSTDHGTWLTAGLLRIIASLACHLDEQEPKSAVFLIFAPTYRHLEQIYYHLVEEWNNKSNPDSLVLSVLHSSVDIEDCIRSMNQVETASSTQRRHILLASAIADSSITIPGVTCVIDTCRSLEVSWQDQSHKAVTIWSSRAICDQRRGRTGRTCPGRVFRCIPKGFYLSSLQEFETPQLTLSECRDASMALLSSASNEINKFQVILQQTLDPPPQHVISEATSYLVEINACFETGGQKSRILATEYGRLMSTMPFAISNARAILTAAQYGYIHEMLLFKSIQTIRPTPIISYFADDRKSTAALMSFKTMVDSKDPISAVLAQMSAYIYWDIYWKRLRRRAAYMAYSDLTTTTRRTGTECTTNDVETMALAHILRQKCNRGRRDFGVWSWTQETEAMHVEWCRKHEINPTSVRAIAESIDITMKILYLARFEPPWLRCCKAEPQWQRRQDWATTAHVTDVAEKDMLEWVYAEFRNEDAMRKKLESILVDPGAMAPGPQGVVPVVSLVPEREACIHFLNGNCTYGDQCRNSHSVLAKRPICRFFVAGSCSKGSACVYAHGNSVAAKMTVKGKGKKQIADPFRSFVPALADRILLEGPRPWFKEHGAGLLLFGESNFAFSLALVSMGISPAIMTDLDNVDTTNLRFRQLDKSRMFGNIDATKVHVYDHLFPSDVMKRLTAFAWNFPYTGADEDPDDHEDLLLATMISTGLLTRKLGLEAPQFALSLQGDQFSRWSVQRIANQAGWHLVSFCKFDHKDFGKYQPCRANGDPFPCEHGRFYVFQWINAIA